MAHGAFVMRLHVAQVMKFIMVSAWCHVHLVSRAIHLEFAKLKFVSTQAIHELVTYLAAPPVHKLATAPALSGVFVTNLLFDL